MAGRQSQAIRNALAVLGVVAQAQTGITAGQISALLRLPRSTTYRIIGVLTAEGYLARLDGRGGLALGVRAAALAGSAPGPVAGPAQDSAAS